jgi:cell wall-associated NlpC family hydrolase
MTGGASRWKFRHTAAMRRGVWLLVSAVVAAALVAGSARAGGSGTTTTATTTTTTPTYAPLSRSSLSAACVGAGAAALVFSPQSVTALGTPASNLGPSAYGAVVSFDSSSSSGSTCRTAGVTLRSVSLFGGAVSASSIQAVDGRGTATGLEVNGAAVAAAAGQTVPVGDWGELMFGATLGRVTAPLVLRLYQAHDGLPAGTAVAVAFGASARPIAKPRQHRQAGTHRKNAIGSSSSPTHPNGAHQSGKQPLRLPPDFPVSAGPFLADGMLAAAGQDSAVVSTAMKYLGVPYRWGGASPKTGFDCSGLVQYVFARLGVYLPHYAAAQWYSPDSVWVRPTRLQPGDLVFFTGSDGTRRAPGHVGIYIDDGYIIDAPHTGSSVRIDSLSERWFANEFVGARRIGGSSLGARHLLHANPGASATALLVGFRPPIAPLGEPLGVAAARTAAVETASRGSWLWAGLVLGVLLLLPFPNDPVVRHRLPPDGGA